MQQPKLLSLFPICFLICTASLKTPAQQGVDNSAESPKVMVAVAPLYPPVAAAARAKGEIIVEVKISRAGKVLSASAAFGNPVLRKAAVAAAYRWHFESGDSEVRTARLTFFFQMDYGDSSSGQVDTVFLPPYNIEITYRLQPHNDYD